MGSVGDSYDNALAETVIGLYKAQLIRPKGPWKAINDLELATVEWVDWYNHRRLHTACDHIPPAEYEAAYYQQKEPATLAGKYEPSLYRTRGSSRKCDGTLRKSDKWRDEVA